MSVFTDLEKIVKDAIASIKDVKNNTLLNDVKSKFIGKKGSISEIMKKMKDLPNEEKPKLGAASNKAKNEIENAINKQRELIENEEINAKLSSETIDVTLPGVSVKRGAIHPLSLITNQLSNHFISLGYTVKEGPEVETDVNNFEKLNLPKDHPARDMQDTFYIDANTLLRTHTSPVQVRTMIEEKGKPLMIVCPGKVYRRDSDDATHSHQFMQLEGLVLGSDITMADLKGTLLSVVKEMFGNDREIRLRPSFFPFTEPSVEVDVTCAKCKGKGCNICKGTGWIEILGAGMVNKEVLRMCGYDDNEVQGFAFGIGIERIAMLKFGVEDIRNFYTNDVRFISQFKEEQ